METLPDTPAYQLAPFTTRGVVRWAQTFLPGWSQNVWWGSRQWLTRTLGQTHEEEFLALAEMGLPFNARILDLGANRGQSIDAVRVVLGKDVRITAVEPSRRLARRLEDRYPGVMVRNVAVGNSTGSFELFTPSYRGFRYDGLASCDEVEAVGWFPYSIWRYDPSLITVEQETVSVVRVDNMRLDVDFIKIDVQGMEMAALRGAEVTITRQRPIVMIEAPDQEIFDFFAALGYQARYWVAGSLTSIRPTWPLNVFFIPS